MESHYSIPFSTLSSYCVVFINFIETLFQSILSSKKLCPSHDEYGQNFNFEFEKYPERRHILVSSNFTNEFTFDQCV